MKAKVAIIVPFYQSKLSDYDLISLQQCASILTAYPKIAIKPQSLVLPAAASNAIFDDVISFDDHFFSGIAGYNCLMLASEFYARFLDFEYILIYQLDAFVFQDDLKYWCEQDFDYIGAPWIRSSPKTNALKSLILKVQGHLSTKFDLKKKGVPNKYQFENKVGNGGLSLRRVFKFHDIALSHRHKIEYYLSKQDHQHNEDAFWSIEVNRKKKKLNIPTWQAGLQFAFETYPETAYQLNHHQLPFGCHDWDNYVDFWRPIFKRYGHQI